MTRAFRLQHLATGLIVVGLLLLAAAGAYYAYSAYAQFQLRSLQGGDVTFSAPPISRITNEPVSLLPVSQSLAARPPSALPPATRIVIEQIGVDSKIVELSTKLEKGELVWETADHAVGHHKGTANPGEIGNVVMSGHISSPLRNEGSVFSRLPDVAIGARIVVNTADTQYLYEVKSKRVVLPSEVSVMDPTPDQTLTLITCVPDWVYSHRLIVTAKPYQDSPSDLIGIRAR